MKKKSYIIPATIVAILAVFAAILAYMVQPADVIPKASDLDLPDFAESELKPWVSTFLEGEMLAWKKEKPLPLVPLETTEPPAPETTEPPEEEQVVATESPTETAASEPLLLKKLISLASDPPPTTEPEPEPEPTTEPPPEPEPEPATEPPPAATEPPPPQIYNDGIQKFLVISFDDGPGPYTERLLEILAANNAKATFFVMGYKVASYGETIKHMVEQGHEVAGHSWNHPYLTKSSGDTIRRELQATSDAIYEVTGTRSPFYRAPYGHYNDNVKNISKELGFSLIQWNIDVGDWKYRNANTVYNNLMSMAKDGGVICVHDVHPTTVDAMERAIPDLIASGYTLLTVSEMFGSMEPGLVYYNRGYAK